MTGNATIIFQSEGWEQALLDYVRFWTKDVILPTIMLIGIFGNALTLCILSTTDSEFSTGTMYVRALATADEMFLISGFMARFCVEKRTFLFWILTPYWMRIGDSAVAISNWIITLFTTERCRHSSSTMHPQDCNTNTSKYYNLTCLWNMFCTNV